MKLKIIVFLVIVAGVSVIALFVSGALLSIGKAPIKIMNLLVHIKRHHDTIILSN